MTATTATVKPPNPGIGMCAMNDAIPVTRLTTASELVRVPAAGVYMGPVGPRGTELEGATCWPAIWVGVAGGCAGGGPGSSLGVVLTGSVYRDKMGLGDGLRVRGRKCENEDEERRVREPEPVSYTHLTLPTNREVWI